MQPIIVDLSFVLSPDALLLIELGLLFHVNLGLRQNGTHTFSETIRGNGIDLARTHACAILGAP